MPYLHFYAHKAPRVYYFRNDSLAHRYTLLYGNYVQDILRKSGTVVDWPPELGNKPQYSFCATSEGSRFVVKTREWPYTGCRHFSIRHGAEFIYYVLAAHNHLPMPEARVLKVDDEQCWAMEFIAGRDALRLKDQSWTPGVKEKFRLTLKDSKDERRNSLRATFLDVMLLGCDRTDWNVLKQETESLLRLYYIDHEQSCGWQNDPSTGGKIRIQTPDKEIEDVRKRYAFFARTHNLKEFAIMKEREEIFNEICLDGELLDKAHSMLPEGWISADQFSEIQKGLLAWWKFLRDRPYNEIDAVLFD